MLSLLCRLYYIYIAKCHISVCLPKEENYIFLLVSNVDKRIIVEITGTTVYRKENKEILWSVTPSTSSARTSDWIGTTPCRPSTLASSPGWWLTTSFCDDKYFSGLLIYVALCLIFRTKIFSRTRWGN